MEGMDVSGSGQGAGPSQPNNKRPPTSPLDRTPQNKRPNVELQSDIIRVEVSKVILSRRDSQHKLMTRFLKVY